MGQAEARQQLAIKVDTLVPSIRARATRADGTSYTAGTWTNQTVTVHYTCADAGSGVASCPADQVFSADGTTAQTSGTATDNAGNCAGTSFGPIQIDTRAPSAPSISSATADTSTTYRWDSTAQQYSYNYKSTATAAQCQFIQASLDDGTTQSVYVGYQSARCPAVDILPGSTDRGLLALRLSRP